MPRPAGASSSLRLPARYYRSYPPDAPLGYAGEELELVPNETVFGLIDVYGKGFDRTRAGGRLAMTPARGGAGTQANTAGGVRRPAAFGAHAGQPEQVRVGARVRS